MNMKRSSVGVERSLENLGSNVQRSYERKFIPQSWSTFQRLRQQRDVSENKASITTSGGKGNVRTVFVNKPTPTSKETFTVSLVTRNDSSQCSKHVTESKPSRHSEKNDRWARSWANHRAHQAVLTRNHSSARSKSCDTQRSSDRTKSMDAPARRSFRVRSRNIELNAKAAAVFSQLKSIYINEEERDRRLQCIRERMNEFQQKSIKKEVNKSIQEFNKRLKEDEQNRKELRRVREKFLETKKQRLKHMHVSKNALEVPAVSRLAYGLPKEGREFSVSFSSKKTTDEIKKLWRMAIVRKQCMDSFINRATQRQQELPAVTVKPRLRVPSLTTSYEPENLVKTRPTKDRLEDPEESKKQFDKPLISTLVKLETGTLDSFESLSSEDEDFEK